MIGATAVLTVRRLRHRGFREQRVELGDLAASR